MLLNRFIIFLISGPLLVINVFLAFYFRNYDVLLILVFEDYVHVLITLHLLYLFESTFTLVVHFVKFSSPFVPPLLALHNFLQSGVLDSSLF